MFTYDKPGLMMLEMKFAVLTMFIINREKLT